MAGPGPAGPLPAWATNKLGGTAKIAAVSGCEKSSSAAMVECLRGKTEEELVQITLKMDFFFISACVDGVFFPKSPRELLSEKSTNAVPYIIGVNNCEFGWVIPMMMKYPPFLDGLDKDVARHILQSNLALFTKGITSEVVDRVYKEYMGDAESPAQVRDGLLDAMGDLYFVISSVEVARHHRGGATKEENQLSRTVMRYWTNFAKNGYKNHIIWAPLGFLKCSESEQSESNGLANGELTFPSVISRNPNGEGLVHWPQYDLEEKYLGIDLEQKAAEKLKQHRMEFWAQFVQQNQTRRRKHTDL
ncbi:hypothetical protein DUI87_13958 [Hirundo rustica rustica]|uniref:Carboxylesterase type B domain-containing protein n=1 Tax=Hirundo rustica rustica TaxID=333673 RepID=A0A3M0K708_HIRRU|nr:hypothetical protein DUI87_13958 [Hirundo rustica rustica]